MPSKTNFPRRALFFTCLVALLLAVFFFYLSDSNGPRYRADAFVVMRPFTNAVLEATFERNVIRTTPGVFRLYFQQSQNVHTVRAAAPVTNVSVVIQVAAVGSTAEVAQQTANDAATRLCALIRKLYVGTTAEILNQARGARPYSFRQDGLKFRLGRRSSTDYTPPAGTVVFTGSGISLDPGDDWKQHYISDPPSARCQPMLMGEGQFNGAFIQIHLSSRMRRGVSCSSATVRLRRANPR